MCIVILSILNTLTECYKYCLLPKYAYNMSLNRTERAEILYLWKKLVLFGDLVKHFMSLNSWFQISSQNLCEK